MHVLIAGERELRAQALHIELLALREKKRERGEIRRRCEPIQRGGRGH